MTSECLGTWWENEARPRTAFIECVLLYNYRWRTFFLEQKKQSDEWFNTFMLKTEWHNWTQNWALTATSKNDKMSMHKFDSCL